MGLGPREERGFGLPRSFHGALEEGSRRLEGAKRVIQTTRAGIEGARRRALGRAAAARAHPSPFASIRPLPGLLSRRPKRAAPEQKQQGKKPAPMLAYMSAITHDKVTRMFNTIDKKHNGEISRDMIIVYAKEHNLPQEYVSDFFHENDNDHNGKIDIWEFRKAVSHKERALKEVFDAEDPKKTGRIKAEAAGAALEKLVLSAHHDPELEKKLEMKEINRLLGMLRGQSKATLNFYEFVDLFALVPIRSIEKVSPYWVEAAHDHLEHTGQALHAKKDTHHKKGSPWGHLLAGATAGAVAKTATSPLNVVCVQSMVTEGATMGGIISSTMKNQGPAGFFNGNGVTVLRAAPSKALDFFLFDFFKNLITGPDEVPNASKRLAAGSLTGMANTTLLYPLEVVGSRLTVKKGVYKSIPDAFKRIIKEEGVGELYAGLGPSLAGIIPYAGITFGMYEILREYYKKATGETNPGVVPNMGCGVVSGWAAMTAAYPLEVVRRRLQVQGMSGGAKAYNGMADCFGKMYKSDGVGVFFKGWGPASMKIVPSAGITFMTYEVMKGLLIRGEDAQKKKELEKKKKKKAA
mmetsp:Transcript_55695/g.176761  ORF Transcript_55695/g.176761 Transcript_55695/m.176761 type:complete len:578 (-) Transcript_55695:67-1800(-)